jgi:peptidoglycan/LPS O-acetylase OafA/YrhL
LGGISTLLCALLLLPIYQVDNWLGNFRYPIYLFYYQIGLSAIAVFDSLGVKLSRADLILLAISIPLLFIFSWVANNAIERPIEKDRVKIKSKK